MEIDIKENSVQCVYSIDGKIGKSRVAGIENWMWNGTGDEEEKKKYFLNIIEHFMTCVRYANNAKFKKYKDSVLSSFFSDEKLSTCIKFLASEFKRFVEENSSNDGIKGTEEYRSIEYCMYALYEIAEFLNINTEKTTV